MTRGPDCHSGIFKGDIILQRPKTLWISVFRFRTEGDLRRRGEPLAATITPGTIAWYRDRAPARWFVADDSGKRVAQGELPLDGNPHLIEVNVPKAGRYDFEFDDSGAGWQIKVAAGKPATIALERGRAYYHAGWMQPMHFNVPKGTKELQYYWAGGPHWVHGPDGKKIKRVETSGKFVRIPVPAGADGKTWSFSELALGHLWFFNAPNRLAASPAALLIPRVLARRDGLLPRRRVLKRRFEHQRILH